MKELKTKFGTLYIEEPTDARADEQRYVIYDSERRWFDYFTTDTVEETWGTYEQFYEELKEKLAKFETVDVLLDYLGIDAYTVSKDWTDLLEDAYGEDYEYKDGKYYTKHNDAYDSEITQESLMDNEWVNKIGDWYIFICE